MEAVTGLSASPRISGPGYRGAPGRGRRGGGYRWLGATPTSADPGDGGGQTILGWNSIVDAAAEHRARRKTGGIFEIDWGGNIASQEAAIRASFAKRNIDPDIAVAVAKSEGLFNYKSTIPGENSFGPFQLHYGDDVWGPKPGLGDLFTKQTGLDARDPKTLQAQIEWTADYVSKHGWGDWRGWKGDRWAGINRDATSYVGAEKNPRRRPSSIPGRAAWTISSTSSPAFSTTRGRERRVST